MAFTLGLASAAQALDPKKAITQYVHEVWQTEQGLPPTVYMIVQTLDGYVWLGTQDGLVRFDGVRFTHFSRRNTPELAGNRSDMVSVLLARRGGGLVLGTYGGDVCRLDEGRFSCDSRKPLPKIHSMLEDRHGRIWVGTANGLFRLDRGERAALGTKDGLSHASIGALAEGADGSLWIATDGGLDHLKDGRFSSLTTAEGLPSNALGPLALDRDGALWIGTLSGLARLKDGVVQAFAARDGLPPAPPVSLLEDRDGNLWIGTSGAGLWRRSGGLFSSFTTREGLSSDVLEFASFLEDREGNLWMGSQGGGVNRLRDGKAVPLTVREGLAGDGARAVFEDRAGTLWLGTDLGLQRLREGRLTTVAGLGAGHVLALLEDRLGRLWIGTSSTRGLFRLEGDRLTTMPLETAATALVEDREGALWCGTADRGLVRLRDGLATTFTTRDGLAHDTVTSLLEDRAGRLWAGTLGGLSRFEGGELRSLTTADGLSSDLVNALHEDRDGALWIATDGGGLCRLKDGKLRAVRASDGLGDDHLVLVLPDGQDRFWISSSYHGLLRVARKDLNDFLEGRRASVSTLTLDTADGMKSAQASIGARNQNTGLRSRDGRLWFATTKGFVTVDPARLNRNEVPPPVVVEEVLADERRVPIPTGAALRIAPGTRRLELRYTALSYAVPRRVRFRYQLDGYDRGWIEAGSERKTQYTNLAPRSYVFRVSACNDDGVWNERGASLAFTLLPRFWQTWWFRGLLGALALGLFAGALGLQRRRLDARRREELRLSDLTRKARELDEARDLQLSLLPKESLRAGPFTVAGRMATASEVGGDYFGYFLAGGRLRVVLADATGHGIASGLIAGMLKSALAGLAQTAACGDGPLAWLSHLNTALRTSISRRGLGICLGIAFVDLETSEVELGMAGVPHPYLVSPAGQVTRLRLPGTPLGYLKAIAASTATQALEPGGRLVLVSDGLIEQGNGTGEEWGYQGVESALEGLCGAEAPPEGIAEGLLRACQLHAAGVPRLDDQTVVVLARRPEGAL